MTERLPRLAARILISAFCGFLTTSAAAGQTKSKAKAINMTTTEFDHLFTTKDWEAVEISRQSGPAIVPHVEPYLRNPDQVIRLLAVDCLAAAGGAQAVQLLIRTLSDANEQIRANAVNGLHANLPVGQEAALMAAWDASKTRDGYVRQQIPMILGRMQAHGKISDLKARLAADPRQEVKDGVIAGMAKLGDVEARRAFGGMLRDARGKRTAELIEFVKYEDEPWVIPLLVPVLQRRDMAIDLSTHRREFKRRECDLAADEVIRISKARFSFGIDPLAQYREEQINEVLRYAQAQPR
jgi:HEAT repeat protein